jgi:hypothetical protein
MCAGALLRRFVPRWQPSVGVLLVALAVCPIACAETDTPSGAPSDATARTHAVEPQAASPGSGIDLVAGPGGAVYTPFVGLHESEARARVAAARSAGADEADLTATVLAVLGSVAAVAVLLRRALNGF